MKLAFLALAARAIIERLPRAVAMVAAASFLDAFYDDPRRRGTWSSLFGHRKCIPRTFAGWIADPSSIVTLAEFSTTRSPIGYSVLIPPDLPIVTSAADVELKPASTPCRGFTDRAWATP